MKLFTLVIAAALMAAPAIAAQIVTTAPAVMAPNAVATPAPDVSAPAADVVVTTAPVTANDPGALVEIPVGEMVNVPLEIFKTVAWPAFLALLWTLFGQTTFGKALIAWLKTEAAQRLGQQAIEWAVTSIRNATKNQVWGVNVSSVLLASALNFLVGKWSIIIDMLGGKEATKEYLLSLMQPFIADEVSGTEVKQRVIQNAQGKFAAIDERGHTLDADTVWLRERAGKDSPGSNVGVAGTVGGTSAAIGGRSA